MQSSVVIIGCGNIGRRHLEGILATGQSLRLFVVEPSAANRSMAEGHLREHGGGIEWSVASDPSGLPAQVDLAILATPAGHRRQAFDQLIAVTSPRFVIFEKVLFTTARDLAEVGAALEARGLTGVVNCGRRGFPDYDRLRRTLSDLRDVDMTVTGSSWGLCSNSVHFLDLAAHVLDRDIEAVDEAALDAEPSPSRHPGCVEFHGTLTARLGGGGTVSLTSLREAGVPLSVTFSRGDESWRVEEGGGRLIHTDPSGRETSEPFTALKVSEMSHLYSEILLDRRSRLTPYDISARQHRLFIDAIRRRLNLSITEDVPCPIT